MAVLCLRPVSGVADNLDEEIRELENFSKVYHLIQSQYIEPTTATQLIRSAIEGMLEDLDPYSEAIDSKEMAELKSNATGRYVGIGISIQIHRNRPVVTQVLKGSPSDKAGLRTGDVLTQLDDVKLTGREQKSLSRLVRGEVGTDLTVSFYHSDNPDKVIRKTIRREYIRFPSIVHFESEPQTIVIQVQQFQKATPDEISAVLAEKAYSAVVLDLRNNPGGLFLAAVETAELFLDGGEIVQTRDRRNRLIERYVALKKPQKTPRLIVILMNRYSASSAEILAGALKDRKAGVIVGEKSYGKGVVQTVFPVGRDLYVKLTTARYVTPSGVSFQGVGIKPDYPVKDTIAARRYGSDDPVYLRSLELIRDFTENGSLPGDVQP